MISILLVIYFIYLGIVSTIAGTGKRGHVDGHAGQATFDSPQSIAIDDQGTIYIVEPHSIRMISTNGKYIQEKHNKRQKKRRKCKT
jgi:hypothetical protein